MNNETENTEITFAESVNVVAHLGIAYEAHIECRYCGETISVLPLVKEFDRRKAEAMYRSHKRDCEAE